ncbi:MAG: hypothetical protein R2856_11105 [Caldilineaceae bacterium]
MRYDLMNRLMTGGQDVAWRQELVELCELLPHGRLPRRWHRHG